MVAADDRSSPGWARARDPAGARTVARMALGIAAILIIVLASLALLNAFLIDPEPGEVGPPGENGEEGEGNGEAGDGEGGDGATCEGTERTFQWIFISLAVIAVALLAVAIARREHAGGRIGTSGWGIGSIVAAFLAVIAFGAWRIMVAVCSGDLDCDGAGNGTRTSFIVLLIATLVCLGLGLVYSHLQRRNFLGTGWGLLGLLIYLPTILTGFAWFVIRTFCTPDLSCELRDEFLRDLGIVFWSGIAGAILATVVGVIIQKRFAHPFLKSGWGVIMILFVLLAALAGAGWLFVNAQEIPGCDEIQPEEPLEPVTCEELRDDLQGRIGLSMIVAALAVAGLITAGLVIHRHKLRRFWSSAWAIVAYVGVGLLVLMGIAYWLVGTMCDEDDGGSSGGGGGNGGGGTGPDDPVQVPLDIDPTALMWVLIAVLVVAGVAVLIVMLRMRGGKEGGEQAQLKAATRMQARERKNVMKLLTQGKLAGADEVMAAYRAFVDWAATQGMPIEPHETPWEHAGRVAGKYDVPRNDMRDFIRAYEIARLSLHEPTSQQREHAVRFAKGLPKEKEAERE